MRPRLRLLSAAAACTALTTVAAIHRHRPPPSLLTTPTTRALTPTSTISAATTTEALRLCSTVRFSLYTLGFRIPSFLDRTIAALLRRKSTLLNPAPPDALLIRLALSADTHPITVLQAGLSQASLPVHAVELDVSELVSAETLSRYSSELLLHAEAWRNYLKTRGTLQSPQPVARECLHKADTLALDAALRVLAAVADLAALHRFSIVLACDLNQADATARLAVRAVAALLARVYGDSVSVLVKVAVGHEFEGRDQFSNTMFSEDRRHGPRLYVTGGDGNWHMREESVGLISAPSAGVDVLRAGGRTCVVVYDLGVGDVQISRLRALRCAQLVRREVLSASPADENRVLGEMAMCSSSRRALAVEGSVMWHVAQRKVLSGR